MTADVYFRDGHELAVSERVTNGAAAVVVFFRRLPGETECCDRDISTLGKEASRVLPRVAAPRPASSRLATLQPTGIRKKKARRIKMAALEGTLEKEKRLQREFCRFVEEAATLLSRGRGGEGEEKEQ